MLQERQIIFEYLHMSTRVVGVDVSVTAHVNTVNSDDLSRLESMGREAVVHFNQVFA